MSKYDEMSDFEINKAVADSMGIYWHSTPSRNGTLSWIYSDNYCECDTKVNAAVELPDYCNDPSASWPIMCRAYIEIKRDSCQAHVSSYFNPDFIVDCRNESHEILRAAMICFLKMKDAENE